MAGPAGSRGPPGDLANPYSEAAVADGDRVYVFHDSAEPLRYDVPDEAWTALPALEAAATTTTRTLPQHWEAVPADDHVLVWLGGVDEADATAEANPAGVVVWQPGD